MSKHTPGPWHISEELDILYGSKTNPDYDNVVADCTQGFSLNYVEERGKLEETKANANLIAAAPDMHEALQKMLPIITYVMNRASTPREDWIQLGNALSIGEDAIKKAEGKRL